MLFWGVNINFDGEYENKFKDDDLSLFYGSEMCFFCCLIFFKGIVIWNLFNN